MGSARLFGASIEGMQNLSMNIAKAHSMDSPYEHADSNGGRKHP